MKSLRSNSMSKKGREVKETGHAWEINFNSLFNRRQKHLNLNGASSDCLIYNEQALEILRPLKVKGHKVSLKSSGTWQFHLGVFPELSDIKFYKRSLQKIVPLGKNKAETCGTHSVKFTNQLNVLKSKDFWWKYLGKGDYLCYTNRIGLWRFFSMKEVIDFVVKNVEWRLIHTGRIKGDINKINIKKDGSEFIKKYSVITFEYREAPHNSFVLGAHGAKNGIRFMEILCQNINYIDIRKV